jgi:SNF2 family DNA or RNA helicase
METQHNYGPFLIIVPMSTLHNNWEYEFDRWLPSCAKVLYDGNREQRRAIRDKFIATQSFNVLMTTFEFAMRDKATLRNIPWEYIIIDEAHRLKNPKVSTTCNSSSSDESQEKHQRLR